MQGLDPDDVIQRNGTFTSDQALDYSTGELLGEDYEYEPLPVAEFIMGNDAWLAAMRKVRVSLLNFGVCTLVDLWSFMLDSKYQGSKFNIPINI